jgi:hypothetical protein
MTNAFGQRISDGMLLVADEYERWVANPSGDKDVRPLLKAATFHMKTMGRNLPLPELAPCAAIIYFATVDLERGVWATLFVKFMVWVMRMAYRDRPMWNDFYMCLWQLSRDDGYIHRLHSHLKHASAMQLETGAWMINSVCQQDEEFRERWQRLVKANGEVFA